MSTKSGSNGQVFKKNSTKVDTNPGFNYQDKTDLNTIVDICVKGGDEAGDEAGGNKAGDVIGGKSEITVIRGGGPKKTDKTVFYTTNTYPETDNDDDKLGLTIKGSSEEFKVAHAKIALLFGRKGEEIKMENINLKIVDTAKLY